MHNNHNIASYIFADAGIITNDKLTNDNLKNIVNNSVKIALSFIHNGIDQTMNIHNTKNLMDENI